MRIYLKYLLVFGLFAMHLGIVAQQTKVDSLKQVYKTSKQDTNTLNILLQLIENIVDEKEWPKYNQQLLTLSEKLATNNNEKIKLKAKKSIAEALNNVGVDNKNKGNTGLALSFYEKSLKIQQELNYKSGIANVYNNIGAIYNDIGNSQKALEFYNKSLKLQEELNDKNAVATTLNNIGATHAYQGDVVNALNYYTRSLKIKEKISDKTGIATSLNNIGFIYESQKNTAEALNYYNKTLKLNQELGDKLGVAASYNNIGVLYKNNGDNDTALIYYTKSLKLYEEIGDKQGIARSYGNIGIIFKAKNDIKNAIEYCQKSLSILKEIGDKQGETYAFLNLGNIYFKQKKYLVALSYSDTANTLAKELGFPDLRSRTERFITKNDSALGNYSEALLHYKQFIIYRDSINNEGTRKATIVSQLNYEFDKKEAVLKEQQEKEKIIANEKDRFQQIIIWSVICGLIIVIVFAAFIFRSLKITKTQKSIIEEKQKEILDSIRYAKRIQTSLLPTEKYIEKNIPTKKS